MSDKCNLKLKCRELRIENFTSRIFACPTSSERL